MGKKRELTQQGMCIRMFLITVLFSKYMKALLTLSYNYYQMPGFVEDIFFWGGWRTTEIYKQKP